MLHAHSTNSRERRQIPFFIAAGAIAASFGLSKLFAYYHLVPPWWLPSADTMALYGLLYAFFDRVLWKIPLVHSLRITRVPNLTGEWHGHVKPTKTNGISAGLGVETPVVFTIKQTWTELLISTKTAQSSSRSLSASMIVVEGCSLSYEYLNEPFAPALDTMHAHRGTARLEYDGKHKRLQGEYYSGRDRQNIGTIVISRH